MDQETLHAVMKEWIEDCKRKWEDSDTEGPTGSMEVHKNTSEGLRYSLGYEADNMDNVSLISEEDLLTTIFCACDIERTGKVAVSKIVDYLRHTTSRGLEDNGIEELFTMLDPDKKDVSMDLGTFHAVMKEWIEDCKGKW